MDALAWKDVNRLATKVWSPLVIPYSWDRATCTYESVSQETETCWGGALSYAIVDIEEENRLMAAAHSCVVVASCETCRRLF